MSADELDRWEQKLKKEHNKKKRDRRFMETEPVKVASTVASSPFVEPATSPCGLGFVLPPVKSPKTMRNRPKRYPSPVKHIDAKSQGFSARANPQSFYTSTTPSEMENVATRTAWIKPKKGSSPAKPTALSKITVVQLSDTEIESRRARLSDVKALTSHLLKMHDHIESTYLMESDNEDAYPTLSKEHGTPINNIFKKVLAASHTTPKPNSNPDVLYLGSYQ